MFDSPTDASAALANYFNQPRLEIVVEALVPAIIFHPLVGEVAVGETKLGGTPDAPEGFDWPRPALPADPEEVAGRGSQDAAEAMRHHIERNLPYAFVAQVDLVEASEAAPEATGLPEDGRLLFFYDFTVGPWDTGSRAARVIWDRSPSNSLRSLTMPADLAEASEREQKAFAEFAENAEAAGGTNYGAPPRAVTMKPAWRLPHPHAVEMDRLPDFAKAAKGEKTDPTIQDEFSAYEEALEAFGDSYPEEPWQRQQLLGSPLPEQSDPRYDAVVATEFGKQHLSTDEWKKHHEEIFSQAKDWVLLLQVDVGDWMQASYVEGTVYFVIRRDHLEQHNFDGVVAVYQQT